MRIAMVGTRGVPARYGGFETCIEEVGRRLVERGHEVRVYCRGEMSAGDSYLGMSLVHRPALKKKSLETLSHTALSAQHLALHRTDVALVFNAANAPFLPILRARRIPLATHVDGLEWKRAKWGANGRRYYRGAEALSVRWSDALIADAQGIADYYAAEFGADTELISYGAPILDNLGAEKLAELGLTAGEFHLVVARFEPENHVAEIVEGYVRSDAQFPLLVVGSAPYADAYTSRISELADDRVRLLGGVWDQDLLDQLYANSLTYLHGHSVGGTNPSLLRAIGAGAATIAFDVSFNREVLGDSGEFFSDPVSVSELISAAEQDRDATLLRGKAAQVRAKAYDWDDIANRYEELCHRLAMRDFPQQRPSGRRVKA
jgi:glycosyltransferase involved in cell wall biosynthesis